MVQSVVEQTNELGELLEVVSFGPGVLHSSQ